MWRYNSFERWGIQGKKERPKYTSLRHITDHDRFLRGAFINTNTMGSVTEMSKTTEGQDRGCRICVLIDTTIHCDRPCQRQPSNQEEPKSLVYKIVQNKYQVDRKRKVLRIHVQRRDSTPDHSSSILQDPVRFLKVETPQVGKMYPQPPQYPFWYQWKSLGRANV